jgi:hypothetical protein
MQNGVDDLNCEDLPSGGLPVAGNDEDNLDADDDGWACEPN